MSVLNRRKRKQRNSKRNAIAVGAGVGIAGLTTGGLLLARRKQPIVTYPTPQPLKQVNPGAVTSVLPHKKPSLRRQLPRLRKKALSTRVRVQPGVVVHVAGKSVDYPDYYRPSVGRSRDSYLDRGTLGKPGGRKRAKKNWNEWDYYKDANKGAYSLRNKERFDSGRFSSRLALSTFSPLYWS